MAASSTMLPARARVGFEQAHQPNQEEHEYQDCEVAYGLSLGAARLYAVNPNYQHDEVWHDRQQTHLRPLAALHKQAFAD